MDLTGKSLFGGFLRSSCWIRCGKTTAGGVVGRPKSLFQSVSWDNLLKVITSSYFNLYDCGINDFLKFSFLDCVRKNPLLALFPSNDIKTQVQNWIRNIDNRGKSAKKCD